MRHPVTSRAQAGLLAVSVIGLTAALGLLGAAEESAPPPRPRPPAPPAGVPSARYFKNVKVLKKLPADRMIPTMQLVSRSLGVGCGFCHVEENFASDAKPEKNVARQMIVMTDSINAHQKIVDGKVTCFTCHHGRSTPESEPPRFIRPQGPGGPPPGGPGGPPPGEPGAPPPPPPGAPPA